MKLPGLQSTPGKSRIPIYSFTIIVSKRVFITGTGIISSIGINIEETLESLLTLRSGVGKISLLDTALEDQLPAAEIKFTDQELSEMAGLPDHVGYTRTALMGIIAAKQAFTSSHADLKSPLRTGLISATTVGGMCKTELLYYDFLSNDSQNRYIYTHDCGDSTEKIADYLGIKGYISTINTACSSSANSIIFGTRLIRNNLLDRVIVGGSDALSKFTLNGFNTLMILDSLPSRPFDDQRAGLNLGEGAGYLVLESEKACKGKEILCEIKGYGNASDAYHQTASSENGIGAGMAMKNAIDLSGLTGKDIDYINVHGTGTENNDLSEGRAIENLFGENTPKFSSTKPYTGHTLGASGGVEAVLAILAIQNNLIYPNLNLSSPMRELKIRPETELLTDYRVNTVLSNSFGFGGNNASLIFSEYCE